MSVSLALLVLVILQIKHLIADYVLQTPYMFLNKGKYGHLGGLLHAATHVVLTGGVLFFSGVGAWTCANIILVEFIIHYHVDWAKEKATVKFRLTPIAARFWNLHGLDQALHQITYVAIVWMIATLRVT